MMSSVRDFVDVVEINQQRIIQSKRNEVQASKNSEESWVGGGNDVNWIASQCIEMEIFCFDLWRSDKKWVSTRKI